MGSTRGPFSICSRESQVAITGAFCGKQNAAGVVFFLLKLNIGLPDPPVVKSESFGRESKCLEQLQEKRSSWRDDRQSNVYLTNTGASGEETQIGKPGIEIVCGGEPYPIAAGSG